MAKHPTPIKWFQGYAPYEDLNRLDQAEQNGTLSGASGQDYMDLAEYLLAGVLEAGPDNGMPEEFTAELFRIWHLLVEAHGPLGLRKAYYHPTS